MEMLVTVPLEIRMLFTETVLIQITTTGSPETGMNLSNQQLESLAQEMFLVPAFYSIPRMNGPFSSL
jgi:hypothetical protein